MARPLVMDTSAILAGIDLPPERVCVAPDAVEDEIEPGGASHRRFEMLKEAGLRLMRADESARGRARAAAERTGDALKISDVDLEVLALAVDLDGELMTDDYAIQNVASELGLPVRAVQQRGIRATWSWVAACRGCGKRFDDPPQGGECPVCGHEVRARRR